ncbi:MAG: DUF1015 domain-containing protein [Candidatus Calescibacterium sp.]|nr:DUF1015 domain-containing protein [Candidatus Calescibacterium sp.]MCX7734087.1 DUF1015 domain-containing protein [bacterium]MDW8087085.1 DUF1015 domain-containing protein [Candidatus Calescibacterium sp.]
MTILKPFYAYRYSDKFKEKISELICPPYDVIDEKLQMELFKNPYNYVRIVLSPHGHDHAAEALKKFISDGIIIKEPKEKIYILEQSFTLGNTTNKVVGIIALISKDAKILVHEQTKSKVIQDRIELLEKTGFNTCPIMLFAKNTNIRDFSEKTQKEKIFDFEYISDDFRITIKGSIYSSEDFSILNELEKTYFFIADGHHRFKAIKTVYEKKNEKYLMAYITDENSGMKIFPIIRELKHKNDVLDKIKSLSKEIHHLNLKNSHNIGEWFDVFKNNKFDCIFIDEKNTLKVNFQKNLEENTINFIHNYILNNFELSFEHSILKSLENMKGRKIECSIIPKVLSVQEIWETVERGEILPPKSTYFWPKIPSGLTLNRTNFSNI